MWCSAGLGISTDASHAAAWRNLGIDNSITNMIASCSQSATGACGISASFQPLLSSCYTGIVHHESTSSIFTSSIYLRTCCTSNDVFRPPHTSEHPAAGLKLTNVNAELESDNACQFYGAKRRSYRTNGPDEVPPAHRAQARKGHWRKVTLDCEGNENFLQRKRSLAD